MSGGAPVPPELIHRANEVLPGCLTFRVYGSTEAPTVTLGIREPRRGRSRRDHRWAHRQSRRAHLRSRTPARPLHGEADGEICTRGPEMMLGYTDWKQTLESFDADGYFHTGDLGPSRSNGDFLTRQRPQEGSDHPRRREHQPEGDRGRAAHASRHQRGGDRRHAARAIGGDRVRVRDRATRAAVSTCRRSPTSLSRKPGWRARSFPSAWSWSRTCRVRRRARCRRTCCGSGLPRC